MKNSKIPTISYENFTNTLYDKIQARGKPVAGQWEITFHCNLRCVHCYVVEDKSKEELTFQEITNILDQIHQEGCLWLSLTGGEPLLRNDFLDIYTYAVKKGFLINILTNGTLITPEIADYLQKYPPFMIEITLNGITAQTYERITQVPGSFKRCMRGIHLILNRDLPLTIKSIGMSLNQDEILKIKQYAESLGKVKYRFDSILIPKLDGSKGPCQFRLSSKEIMDIEYSDNNMRQEWKEHFQADHELYETDNLFQCGGGISLFNISPYGELQLCHLLHKPSFDLRQGPFKEGFYQLFPRIRSAEYHTNSKCKKCQIRYLCRQCPARAKLENGNFQIPVDYFCELAHRRNRMKAILVD